MKTLLLSGWFAALSCTGVLGAPCVPGNFQTFMDLGGTGCEISTVQFTGFAMLPGLSAATPLNPAEVLVTPDATALNPTLLLTLDRTAAAGEAFESLIRLSVSGSLRDASIGLTHPRVTGDSAVTGVLDVCPNNSFATDAPVGCPTSPASLMVFAINTSSLLSDSASFPGSRSLDVFVDLTIDGGRSGSASLDSATVEFSSGPSSSVPEPSAGVLVALGLSAFGISRTRQRRCSGEIRTPARRNSLLDARLSRDASHSPASRT